MSAWTASPCARCFRPRPTNPSPRASSTSVGSASRKESRAPAASPRRAVIAATGVRDVAEKEGGNAATVGAGAAGVTMADPSVRGRVTGVAAGTGRSGHRACVQGVSTATPGWPRLRPSSGQSPNGWRTRESARSAKPPRRSLRALPARRRRSPARAPRRVSPSWRRCSRDCVPPTGAIEPRRLVACAMTWNCATCGRWLPEHPRTSPPRSSAVSLTSCARILWPGSTASTPPGSRISVRCSGRVA